MFKVLIMKKVQLNYFILDKTVIVKILNILEPRHQSVVLNGRRSQIFLEEVEIVYLKE